jgi:tetratricopeptide (TPR) repeat protein
VDVQQIIDRGLELIHGGKLDEAVVLIRQGLALAPHAADLHRNLGVALARLGRLDEAIEHFQQAASLEPDCVDHYRNLAVALGQRGRLEESAGVLGRIVTMATSDSRAHYDLGHMLRLLKRLDAAVASYREALRLRPDFPEAHHDLGMALSQMGCKDEARRCYEEALSLKPDSCEALNNLGVLLEDMGKLEEAVECFRRGLRINPNSDETHNNLGVALAAMGKHEEAIPCYRQALALNPRSPHGYNNLGNALRTVGEVDEAISCLRQAIRLRPDYAEAYNNSAIALVQKGQITEAMAHYERALYYHPDYPEAHMNRALAWLGEGDYEQGWTEYEWRWKGKDMRHPEAGVHRRRWLGAVPEGRTILLKAEQGLGDTIQFVRYARLVRRRGATVILEGQKPLERLLKTCPGIDRFVPRGTGEVAFDFYAPLLSLPGIFRTTIETVPDDVPYLFPDEGLVASWRARLAQIEGFKVGIAWQGNPDYRGDRLRSVPLRCFAPLADIAGVKLVSLQKGPGAEQIAGVAGEFHVEDLGEIDEQSGAFMDTAAIMKGLDLVITSDTAIPHLAGALGVPVWMATPFAPDWRWLRRGEHCPWYPTMRLFRQQRPGEWEPVFEEIAVALRAHVEGATSRAERSVPANDRAAEARELRDQAVGRIEQGELPEATQLLERAVRLDPGSVEAHHDLGVAWARQKRLDKAVAHFRRALELRPDFVDALGNLGLAYLEQADLDAAETHLRRALQVGPSTPEMHNNLGVTLLRGGRAREAALCYQQALQSRPDYAEAHLNLARALLVQGQYEQGWLEYEWRFKCPGYRHRPTFKPRWGGTPLADRRILLLSEQGLGDTLQFVRYVSLVKQGGGSVVLECQPPLVPLLKLHPHVDGVVAAGAASPDHDCYAPLLSLPGLLQTTLATIPAHVPYLAADAGLASWRSRLAAIDGFKVGIAWQGNPDYDGDVQRSIPLVHFGILAHVPGVRLVSLQKGTGTGQLAAAQVQFPVVDFGPELDERAGAFMDTAAILQGLDLVITSDTALAHLAGALGRPVWVALPFVADCRWLERREDCPWYPTMRLFRQRTRGDWNGVFRQMALTLQSQVAVSRALPLSPPAIPGRAGAVDAKAHHAAGVQATQDGNLGLAADCFRRAVACDPRLATAHHDLGVVYARQSRLDEAIRCFHTAAELDPNSFGARENLALAYLDARQPAAAEQELRKLMQRGRDSGALRNHLGVALANQNRFREAVEQYQRALESEPESPEACNNLGNALRALGDLAGATTLYERAIRIRPDYAEPYNNQGIALSQSNELERAVESYREAIRLCPDHSEAHNNLGVALADLDRLEEAIAAFRQSLYLRPDHAETHKNLGLVLLLSGDFKQGWLEYEWRFHSPAAPKRTLRVPRWDGGPLGGRRIVLHAEQGLGDTLQFVRYASLVQDRGGHVIVECQRPLARILGRALGISQVIAAGDDWGDVDAHAPLMSLPGVFQHSLASVPASVPYLSADPGLEDLWGGKVRQVGGFKVGVAWQGSPTYAGDRNRSIPLCCFRPLTQIDGVRLVSLQKGEGESQMDDSSLGFHVVRFAGLDDAAGPFMDTAAIMKHLDLVVTADTAAAHLAGAMGIPVWLALCRTCDWRWLRGRNDSPWYPTMRLFRQATAGDWTEVMRRVAQELKSYVQ